ncbi:hypothetical protein R77592_04504 [Ralstonia mannitolilytica]|jgi:hypothetical protein|uniref:hypothetical protein n=1 Tax=Ralstonia mannitolilytica TaxID=105219 RepID=UPI0028F643A8|nr:hypothetical protein R77592_04504 [Ralstonia mannitolilytica]
MAAARILEHSNVFADGVSHAGALEGSPLPKRTGKLGEYRAGLRGLVRSGRLLDGDVWFDPAVNEKDALMAGRLAICYTPVPPLEDLTFRQRITDRYLMQFADAVKAA